MTEVSADRPKVRSGRGRLWLAVHGWLALPIWVLLFVICVTGTLLTVAHELVWLVDPSIRAPNPDGLPRAPLNDIVAAVTAAYPEAMIGYVRELEPYLALKVGIALPDAPLAKAYVNPYTAQIQAVALTPGFVDVLFALHSWLLFPWSGNFNLGWYIVTALGFPMLGSVITGLIVYKKFWRAFTRPSLRLNLGPRVFWGDLHRLAGVWSLWFILVVAISGGWFMVSLLIHQSGYQIIPNPPLVERSDVPPPAPGATRLTPDLDGAVAAAGATVPGLAWSYVRLPDSAYSHTTVFGFRGVSLFGKYGERVYVNPYTGAVGGTMLTQDMSTLQAVSRLLPALHFGSFGGLWSKLVWFVFGLGLSAMVLSGIVIWTRRTAAATREAVRLVAVPAAAE